MSKKLTQGNVFHTIVFFSLPYLFSYFLQTLYGLADLFIAGQFNGPDVISAVAIGSQVMHMITVIIVGLAMGTTVLISRATGAGDTATASHVAGNTAVIFMIVSVIFTAVLLVCCPAIVAVMSTPQEAVPLTIQYLTICFAGIPFITAYNIVAAIYRGAGDSRSPMYFVILACVLNVILDYVCIGVYDMKASGAAIATVLAQTISVVLSLVYMKRAHLGLSVTLSDFKPDVSVIAELLRIGVPVACQDGCIQISFLLITIIANRRGLEVAAAVGIVEKIISFLFLVPSTMLSAVSAIVAQNIGAKEYERGDKTLFYACAIAGTFGLVIGIAFQWIAEPFLSLFTSDANVVLLGVQYIRSYVFDCFFAAFHFSFSGYFCAYGKSLISFMHNIISIIAVRIPGAYFASVLFPHTLFPMGAAAPLGSLLSALICIGVFIYMRHRSYPERHQSQHE
ncbi:MAG: MATE family efflux transporter [Treponema sp.]|nr:MATE family efflux transporter [Treponema sp.]